LSIQIRGDGSIDDQELAIVEEIAVWMKANGESIFGTRPWKVFGEGPASVSAAALTNQGFNEGSGKPFTSEDIRFTTKVDILYAIALGDAVEGKFRIKSLAAGSKFYAGSIGKLILMGSDLSLTFTRNSEYLEINVPDTLAKQAAYAFKIMPA
jgi:alpha-L-fucosidase